MGADPRGVLSGQHYLDGNHAASEGALAAGCRFAAGYPITPSTEIVERIAARFPMMGGMFIQMEDEIGASIALQGAVWAGAKALTVTSGPGFSLMMEHVGLAAMTECPCVFINVQRGGPSTGLPTLPGQADMMQARWGSHGDYEIIALSPESPQEAFSLTVEAFNLAEQWRVPVMLMMDECVGHMTERVIIPPADQIRVVERRWTTRKPGEYRPYEPCADMVPDMAKAGDGYDLFVTGLTHDERGYPAMNWKAQEKLVRRLVDKIRLNSDKIVRNEEDQIDGAEVVVVSYGITSRVARKAIQIARENGVKVGALRMLVVWPFPEKRIAQIASKVRAFVVPELNYGQMSLEVERAAAGRCATVCVGHGGGEVHDPQVIAEAIMMAARKAA
jgi:2-oxoglutarate/2-oxoacid ferredoxin oxidoreductase subunit alpha